MRTTTRLRWGFSVMALMAAVALSGCEMISMISQSMGHWDGSAPLMCGGSQSITVENLTINLPGSSAIQAGGNCQVTLINTTLTAGTAIDAGGDAVITIRGGSVTGTENALSLGGNARVNIEQGAVVNGPISSGGSAVVTGLPEGDPRLASTRSTPVDPAEEAARTRICTDLTACYAQLNAYGQISGRVLVDLAADGSITNATYEGGQAPEPVQQCLTQTARSRPVVGWSGGAARVTCEYSGTYMQGIQQMMHSSSLVRTPAAL